jgi:hypothetical protein
MELPKRLYKYQPPSTQALANLSAAKLWFSHPSKFNDPFDCALEASFSEISDDDRERLVRWAAPSHLQDELLKLDPEESRRKAHGRDRRLGLGWFFGSLYHATSTSTLPLAAAFG